MADLAPRLLSVLRRPGGLSALVSTRNPDYESGDTETWPYLETLGSLGDVPESICPWRDRDLKAWRSLRSVPAINKRAATAIVRSIIGSVVAPDVRIGHLDDLDFSRPVDLQPYLCSADGEQAVLLLIADTVTLATENTDLPDWHLTHRQQLPALLAEFRRTFLWGLHLSPWDRVERTARLYDELSLDTSPALRCAIARMLTLTDRETGLAWCEALRAIAPDRRTQSVHAIVESGAMRQHPERVADRPR